MKENQDLKENNAHLLAQKLLAPGPKERTFQWPDYPEPSNEAEKKEYHALEQAAIFEEAALTIEHHPMFKPNFRSAPVRQLLEEEAKKWRKKADNDDL